MRRFSLAHRRAISLAQKRRWSEFRRKKKAPINGAAKQKMLKTIARLERQIRLA